MICSVVVPTWNEGGRRRGKRGAVVLWCCRWKRERKFSVHTHFQLLVVVLTHTLSGGIFVLLSECLSSSVALHQAVTEYRGVRTRMPSWWSLGSLLLLPVYLLSFFPPPPGVFLLQTVPPLCAANHHDNLSGLLLKIHHRSIKN